jgi:hypothetical protein
MSPLLPRFRPRSRPLAKVTSDFFSAGFAGSGDLDVLHSVTAEVGGAPGGEWGVAPYDGAILDISGNTHRVTQYNHNNIWTRPTHNGRRLYMGLQTNGDLTTWRNNEVGDPPQPQYTISRIGAADFHMVQGGYVLGNSPEDGTEFWEDGMSPTNYHSQAGIYLTGFKNGTLEYFSCYNKGDGISQTYEERGRNDGAVFRWNALENCGDDGLSNDGQNEIIIYQNYISSALSMVESRPTSENQQSDASDRVMTLDGNLLWLKGKKYADSGLPAGTPGVLRFWKAQVVNPQFSIKWRLVNNVLRYDSDARIVATWGTTTTEWGSLAQSQLVESSNNVLCFTARTAAQGLPPNWPTWITGFTYLYSDTGAASTWNSTINAWEAAHPQVKITDKGII